MSMKGTDMPLANSSCGRYSAAASCTPNFVSHISEQLVELCLWHCLERLVSTQLAFCMPELLPFPGARRDHQLLQLSPE